MSKNPHAQALGSLGGKSTSEAKKKASAENGKKGGRPRVWYCLMCAAKLTFKNGGTYGCRHVDC